MRRLLPLLGGILLGLGIGTVIFFGLLKRDSAFSPQNSIKESDPIPVPSLNAPAPGFELVNLEGDAVKLDDYRGKLIILNFWASWCAPCRLEMPIFQKKFRNQANNLAVVAVNNAESRQDVEEFVNELDLSFEFLLDPDARIQRLYQIHGYPTTIIIDTDGVIRARHIGLMTEEQLNDYLESIELP